MQESLSPARIAESLQEFWTPRIIGEVDDAFIKVAKLKGRLAWHTHDDEDELFFVLRGKLSIELEHATIELSEGEMYVVQKGVPHNPIANEECHVLLVERKTTLHTGATVTNKTVAIDKQFG